MSTNPQVSQLAADVPSTQSCRQKTDPAWDHCTSTMEGRKKVYSCTFCGKIFKGGGINRVKQHLAGKIGDVLGCKKVDPDTRFRMEENLKEISGKRKRASEVWDDENPYGPNVMELDGEDEQAIPPPHSAEAVVNNTAPSTQNAKRRATGGVPNFFAPRTTPGAQPTIKSVLAGKEAVHRVDIAIATFFYENCIPMNALNSSSYQKMIDAIGALGPGYKGPSYHAVRTNLLSDMKKEVQLLVDTCRGHWGETGCTIMGDGWQDIKNRQLINFLVYCPRGISFIKSVDASDVVKDATTLCNLFAELVEYVGPKNVVHLVTDNAANYKAAGKLLNDKYPNVYWSPCAAHCLNLVLGDIGKMELGASLKGYTQKREIDWSIKG